MLIGRAVLKEVARTFLGALAATTGVAFFLMALTFMKRAPGVGLGILLELFPLFFPLALQFTVPAAALASVVLTFSRMQVDRELTALSASGVNLFLIVWPVLAAAAVVSLASLLLLDIVTPFAAARLRDAQRDLAAQMEMSFRSGLRDLNLNTARLSFENFENGRFDDVLIEVRQDNNRTRLFRARSGGFRVNENDVAEFEFNSLALSVPAMEDTGRTNAAFSNIAGSLNLDEVVLSGGGLRKRNDLEAWELAYFTRRAITDDDKYGRFISVETHEELARRSALAASAFFFALVGIPLGILAGRKAKVAAVITACAPVVIVYFPLVIVGANLGKAGTLPAYPAVWLGNVVLGIGGSYLLYRVALR
ncbi:MAG: LptF/LptG family permease [Planctomycetota bacterium]